MTNKVFVKLHGVTRNGKYKGVQLYLHIEGFPKTKLKATTRQWPIVEWMEDQNGNNYKRGHWAQYISKLGLKAKYGDKHIQQKWQGNSWIEVEPTWDHGHLLINMPETIRKDVEPADA